MSTKIYKNGKWIECAGQPDISNLATKDDLNTCFSTAEQSANKLTIKKGNGSSFEYEPELPTAMVFKGTCLQANLPTSGQVIGDYWKLSDTEGVYVGQCAIWDGTQWTYSNSNIAVEQTLQPESTNPVSGAAVFSYLQSFYDALHPVGSAHFGITAPVVPNGINATWFLLDQIDGSAVWVDSTKEAGSVEEEEGTIGGTFLTINQLPWHDHTGQTYSSGGHWHQKGSMNITGYLGPVSTDRASGGTLDHSGALSYGNWDDSGGNHSGGKRVSVRLNATDGWTGNTSWGGEHKHSLYGQGKGETHTHTISNIKPKRVNIKVWLRSS